MKRKKTLAAILTAAAVAGSSLTALAAPETMPDGTVFDAEYYAQTYPDVAAALGTDRDTLYHHYVTCGKSEGRNACAPGTEQNAAQTPASTTVADTTLKTPIEVLIGMCGMPEFMLTDSRPIVYSFHMKPNPVLHIDAGDDMYHYYYYDAKGRLTGTLDHLDQKRLLFYDDNDRVIRYVCDLDIGYPHSIIYQFIYDENGRLSELARYDENGRLSKLYDESEMPSKISEIIGRSQAISYPVIYDEQGHVAKIIESDGDMYYEFRYNEQGKLAQIYDGIYEGGHLYGDFLYDEQGRLTKYILYSPSAIDHILKYDTSGRLTGTDSPQIFYNYAGTYSYQ